jgi:6,7-dimethyl-8-ribityllumazine synthase
MVHASSRIPPPRLPPGVRIGIVVSRYHAEIVDRMLASARAVLLDAGLPPEDLIVVQAPGAFELPLIARMLASSSEIHAVLCFGLVLKGETSHDEHIARAAADGLMRASLDAVTPIHFGVLTCDDLDQAQKRARTRAEGGLDKGAEVALAAIATINSLQELADLGLLEHDDFEDVPTEFSGPLGPEEEDEP